jgi:hypothetical protein
MFAINAFQILPHVGWAQSEDFGRRVCTTHGDVGCSSARCAINGPHSTRLLREEAVPLATLYRYETRFRLFVRLCKTADGVRSGRRSWPGRQRERAHDQAGRSTSSEAACLTDGAGLGSVLGAPRIDGRGGGCRSAASR